MAAALLAPWRGGGVSSSFPPRAAGGSRDCQQAELSYMSLEQIVETCVRLDSRRQMMEILFGELQNEKSKLQRHQIMLSDRIARVEGSASVARPQAVPAPTPAYPACAAPTPRALGLAGLAHAGAAQPLEPPPLTVPERETERPAAAAAVAAVDAAATAAAAESAVAAVAAGVVASALCERLKPAPGSAGELSAPEELLLKVKPPGIACLTWFYNEQVLEQLAAPDHPIRRLSFEIRQQSEGANGRLRSRIHACECQGLLDGEEVGEQSFEVDGCLPSKAYAFSVRARAEMDGRASPMYSAYADTVTLGAFSHLAQQLNSAIASSLGCQSTAVQSTTVSTPRSSSFAELATMRDDNEDDALRSRREQDSQRLGEARAVWPISCVGQEEGRRRREEEGEEARRRIEEELRRQMDIKRRAEQEEARRRAEEEDARRLAEQEEARRRAGEEEIVRRLAQEEEARRRAEEARLCAAEETRRLFAEEEARLRAEAEAEVVERQRRAALKEARRRADEEGSRRQAEEALSDARRHAVEARRRAEETDEARRKQEEEAEAALLQVEETRRAEAARIHAEVLAVRKRVEEEEARRLEEARRQEEESLRRQAEEARRAEEARQRLAEAEALVRRREEEAEMNRRRASLDEAQRSVLAEEEEQARRRAQEEALQLRLDEEVQHRAQEELRRREEEEARKREELEAERLLGEDLTCSWLRPRPPAEREVARPAETGAAFFSAAGHGRQQEVEEEQRRLQADMRKVLEQEQAMQARRRHGGEGPVASAAALAATAAAARALGGGERRLESHLDVEGGTGTSDVTRAPSQQHSQAALGQYGQPRTRSPERPDGFARGFAQYCKEKAPASSQSGANGAAPEEAAAQQAPGISQRWQPWGRAAAAAGSRPGDSAARSAARSPVLEMARSPVGARSPSRTARTPGEEDVVGLAFNELQGSRHNSRNDPMDKWMSKILSEGGGPSSGRTALGTPARVGGGGVGSPEALHASSLLPSASSSSYAKAYTAERSTLGDVVGGTTRDEERDLVLEAERRGASLEPGHFRRDKMLLSPQIGEERQLGPMTPALTVPQRQMSHAGHHQVQATHGANSDGLGPTVMELPTRAGGSYNPPARETSVGVPQLRRTGYGDRHNASDIGLGGHGGGTVSHPIASVGAFPGQTMTVPRSKTFGSQYNPGQYGIHNASGMGSVGIGALGTVANSNPGSASLAASGALSRASASGQVTPALHAQGWGPTPALPRTGSFSAYANVKPPSASAYPGSAQQAQLGRQHGMPGPAPGPPGPPSGPALPAGAAQKRHPSPPRRGAGTAGGAQAAMHAMRQQSVPVGNLHQGPGPLELSQRMARANELASRYQGGGAHSGASTGAATPHGGPLFGTGMQAPSLLNWAAKEKHHSQQSGFWEEPSGDPLGLGLGTLHNLPPPPRSAPAAEGLAGVGSHGGRGGGRDVSSHVLKVLTSDNKWESLSFSAGDRLDSVGADFLRRTGLKGAFRSGLISKMQAMLSSGQAAASVDIVDLI